MLTRFVARHAFQRFHELESGTQKLKVSAETFDSGSVRLCV